jgi:hypothetical protein
MPEALLDAPAAPVAPVAPVAPCGPVAPVAPVAPLAPVALTGPIGPVGPGGPTVPVFDRPIGAPAPTAPAMSKRGAIVTKKVRVSERHKRPVAKLFPSIYLPERGWIRFTVPAADADCPSGCQDLGEF